MRAPPLRSTRRPSSCRAAVTVSVRVILNAPRLADTLRLELKPAARRHRHSKRGDGARRPVAITLRADPAKVKAGLKGYLIRGRVHGTRPQSGR